MEYRFDVFGRDVVVAREGEAWLVMYAGEAGKRRPAEDLRIPAAIRPEELLRYLADLCHEWTTDERPDVVPRAAVK